MKTRMAIIGMGALTPVGDSPKKVWESIRFGKSNIKPHCTESGPVGYISLLSDYDPTRYLGQRGFRYYSTCTRYLLSSILPALADAKIQEGGDDLGIVTGTAFSAAEEWRSLAQTIVDGGYTSISPMESYNFSANMPSSLASIKTGAKAFNVTICTGTVAGLDAVSFALEALEQGRAKRVVVAGVEEMGAFAFECFRGTSYVAPCRDGQEKPFPPADPMRNGFSLGEGSAALVLEHEADALARGARVYAVIAAYRAAFVPDMSEKIDVELFACLIRATLTDAGVAPEQVAGIVSGASGSIIADGIETEALESVFGTKAHPPVTTAKSSTGEAFGMSGILHHIIGALSIDRGSLPISDIGTISEDQVVLITHVGDEGCLYASIVRHP